jgi:hypothetical protein
MFVRVALIDPALDDPEFGQDVGNGIKFLDAAIARDPSFLLAYCKLAQAHDFFSTSTMVGHVDSWPKQIMQ